jgi:hypothetical protein
MHGYCRAFVAQCNGKDLSMAQPKKRERLQMSILLIFSFVSTPAHPGDSSPLIHILSKGISSN